jgi:hypothetical protein
VYNALSWGGEVKILVSVQTIKEEWKRLHNKELYALYSSSDIIRVMNSKRLKWAGHAACMGKRSGAYRALVGKPEGRRQFGRPRRGC